MISQIKQRIDQLRRGEVPEGYKKTKAGTIPNEWNLCMISDCLEKVDNPVEVEPDTLYTQIGIRSHGKGLFYKEPITGKELGNKSVFWVEPNCFVLNIVFAWEQAFGKTTADEVGMIGSHRFPMYRPINDSVDLDYLIYYFMTKRGTDVLDAASPGGAGRNRTLGQDRFMRSKILLPPLAEQEKIAEILSAQDKLIALKEKLIEEKKRQKKYLMQQLLTGKQRLPGFSGEWMKYSFNQIFETVSSRNKQISSEEYLENSVFPVVDQGKKKIIAYSNQQEKVLKCPSDGLIVFGDHTREVKYIDFDFIVGADGTQILKSKNDIVSTQFLYYALSSKNIKNDGYSRHFKYVKEFVYFVPTQKEQKEIIRVFSLIDKEIDLLELNLSQEKHKKKALMQLLLSGVVRVNV